MTDWIENAARRVISEAEREKQEYDKRVLNEQTIQREIPRIWQTLGNAIQDAVREFNGYFPDQIGGNLLHVARPQDSKITISQTLIKVGEEAIKLDIECRPNNQEIVCECPIKGLVPERFYFKVRNGGSVYLVVANQERELTTPAVVEMLLGPVFLKVRPPIP